MSMDKTLLKIGFIEDYIRRCDDASGDEAKTLAYEIVNAFYGDVKWQTSYPENLGLRNLKAILNNLLADIEWKIMQMEHESELARLKQPLVSAHAESSPVQNQSVNITISLEQTLSLIDEIPENKLSADDKEALREKLYSLEGVKSTKDKTKIWEKAKEVLKFLADKGADAAIAALPLVGRACQEAWNYG